MRDIVATIQREQDEAIRSPGSGVTIVAGGPGTGKTAVALHRAAYLLYSDRSRYAGGGILVVGPSSVFVEYIGSVLPSLGEDTATLHSLGSLFPGMTATRTDPPEVAAVKGSLRMRRVLERAARDAVPGGPAELRLLYRGTLLRLDRRRAGPDPGPGAATRARAATRCAGPASTGCSTRSGRRPVELSGRPAAGAARTSRRRSPSGRSSGSSSRRGGPGCTPGTCWAGWPTRSGCAGTPAGSSPGGDPAARRRVPDAGPDGPTIADVALLDELDALLGKPRAAGAARARPVPARRGRTGVEHARRPAAGRPRGGPGAPGRTTGTTRTWWWTRRRTSRRCSGG